jgi:ADP-ribosyl-[dinitrogen reductase] hydrolase
MAGLLYRAFRGASKDDVLFGHPGFRGASAIEAIARGDYRHKPATAIRGSGYVVESLEAALWCLWRPDTFEAAVLAAANLGDDADTTAAVCGQLAGAYYGVEVIPARWRERIAMGPLILDLADRLRRDV